MHFQGLSFFVFLCIALSSAMVDVKWTPSSKKPIRPFSKRFRDANPEPEDAQEPENQVSDIASLVYNNPISSGATVVAGLTAVTAIKLHRQVKSGTPIILSSSNPIIFATKPSSEFLFRKFLPLVQTFEKSAQILDSIPASNPITPEFARTSLRTEIGCGEQDYKTAVDSMRTWKLTEAANWIECLSRSESRDLVALSFKCFLGYIVAPFQVQQRWTDVQSTCDDGTTTLSSGMTCAAVGGHFLNCSLTFTAKWARPVDGGQGGAVVFELLCDSRLAGGPALLSAVPRLYARRLHQLALPLFGGRMADICRESRELRQLRQRVTGRR